MSAGSFRSASGLRPTTAFFGVAIVLVMVLVRAVALAVDERFEQPHRLTEERLPEPDFDIVDRSRRTLARSVERLDLAMSPRAMWQAHTPDRMARALAGALEERASEEAVLAAMLPDAEEGVIRVADPLFDLDFDAARRVQSWLGASGVPGIWIERAAHPGHWTLCWQPAVTLSQEARDASAGVNPPGPLRWARRLALDLARCVLGPECVSGESANPSDLARQHDRIWRALMPTADRVVLEGLDGAEAARVAKVLDDQGVEEHQMAIRFRCERTYPVRDGGDDEAGFAILGDWRYPDRERALGLAARELGFAADAAPRALEPALEQRVGEILDHKQPASGLELCASNLLEGDAWRFAAGTPAIYRYRRDWPVHRESRRYYLADRPESEAPRVVSTLDSSLQIFLRRELEAVIAQHHPALAMGIALDVKTGDVLAIDGTSPYEVSEFLPTWHLFTPGSTFKVLVMALALDQGVVTPEEQFDTHDGFYAIPGSHRVIREAEGPPGGWQQARAALAYSINAVLVQIGARIPQRVFHDRLVELGYGEAPRAGIGAERAGSVPGLPWKPAYEQASVSFGHELAVSLWQHAAGLATVVRGGEYVPLRLLSAVEADGKRYDLPRPVPERVLSRSACEEVRRMMALGAQIGTGRHLWKREVDAGTPMTLMTKTGTAEKVPTEVCLHLELERNQHNAKLERDDPAWESFDELKARPKPHKRSCYTSSICVVGSALGSDREVMVLLVADEPTGKSKFGSEVAGPAAVAVLKEALGLTSGGRPIDADGRALPPTDYRSEKNPWERPWEERSGSEEGQGGW